jgi:hypothetical protein
MMRRAGPLSGGDDDDANATHNRTSKRPSTPVESKGRAAIAMNL